MKKLLVILLGFCFALPAFAADVRAVDNEAWLDHLAQMQVLRQQILSVVTTTNATPEDKALLESLNAEFSARKADWDAYLVNVSQGQEVVKTDTGKTCPKGNKCCKVTGKKCDGNCKDCGEIKKHKKHGKKQWGHHVCGEACKNGCTKAKMKDCCGSAMCKEAKKECGKEAQKSCKGCAKGSKCGKKALKEAPKACPKGDKCHKITGIKCDKPCKNCSDANEAKKTVKSGKKRWGHHVCGEACKNGCIKPKKADCCGSAMCKELGHCIRTPKID
ncbi:MAG: hypothetical protein KKB51_21545 [Candidatus Riflebacteria bacterium]|nr:hypothetical protein [Candidatus Riflebacteria bacterium]